MVVGLIVMHCLSTNFTAIAVLLLGIRSRLTLAVRATRLPGCTLASEHAPARVGLQVNTQ